MRSRQLHQQEPAPAQKLHPWIFLFNCSRSMEESLLPSHASCLYNLKVEASESCNFMNFLSLLSLVLESHENMPFPSFLGGSV